VRFTRALAEPGHRGRVEEPCPRSGQLTLALRWQLQEASAARRAAELHRGRWPAGVAPQRISVNRPRKSRALLAQAVRCRRPRHARRRARERARALVASAQLGRRAQVRFRMRRVPQLAKRSGLLAGLVYATNLAGVQARDPQRGADRGGGARRSRRTEREVLRSQCRSCRTAQPRVMSRLARLRGQRR